MQVNPEHIRRSLSQSVDTEWPPSHVRVTVLGSATAPRHSRSRANWKPRADAAVASLIIVAVVFAIFVMPGLSTGDGRGVGPSPRAGQEPPVGQRVVPTGESTVHDNERDAAAATLLPAPTLHPDPAAIESALQRHGIQVHDISQQPDGLVNSAETVVFETSAGTLKLKVFSSERALSAGTLTSGDYPGWNLVVQRNVRLLADNAELARIASEAALDFENVPVAETAPAIFRLALALRQLGYRTEAINRSKLESFFTGDYRAFWVEASHPESGLEIVEVVVFADADARANAEPRAGNAIDDFMRRFFADGEALITTSDDFRIALGEALQLEHMVTYAERSGLPTCPDPEQLQVTGANAETPLILDALLPRMVAHIYADPEHADYVIGSVTPATAPEAGIHGEMPESWCGPEVRERTWVVKLTFPDLALSASLSAGQFFVSETASGWHVWFVYH